MLRQDFGELWQLRACFSLKIAPFERFLGVFEGKWKVKSERENEKSRILSSYRPICTTLNWWLTNHLDGFKKM